LPRPVCPARTAKFEKTAGFFGLRPPRRRRTGSGPPLACAAGPGKDCAPTRLVARTSKPPLSRALELIAGRRQVMEGPNAGG